MTMGGDGGTGVTGAGVAAATALVSAAGYGLGTTASTIMTSKGAPNKVAMAKLR